MKRKIGRWETFSSPKINAEDLDIAIAELLKEYGDMIYIATENGLDIAQKKLINNLKSASPKKTGKFKKGWKGTGKKYKLVRFIGNKTTVEGRGGERIALANILEYSTTRGRPFIKHTFEKSVDEIARAVVNEIKKEA